MLHNYWARATEPTDCKYWAPVPQLLEPACPGACAPQPDEPPQRGARTRPPTLHEGKPSHSSEDPAQPKENSSNKNYLKKFFCFFSLREGSVKKWRQQEWENPSLAGRSREAQWFLIRRQVGWEEQVYNGRGWESWTDGWLFVEPEDPAGAERVKCFFWISRREGCPLLPTPHLLPRFPFLFISLLPPFIPILIHPSFILFLYLLCSSLSFYFYSCLIPAWSHW